MEGSNIQDVLRIKRAIGKEVELGKCYKVEGN